MSNATIAHIYVKGLNIAHAVTGEGQPVLLLHGWGANLQLLWQLGEQIAKNGFRVYMPDLPGFGESDLPSEIWDVHDYVKFVLDYMDTVGISEKVFLFGHSFGGRLSIVLGANHADRFQKIVLCDAAGVKVKLPLHKQLPINIYHSIKDSIDKNTAVGRVFERFRNMYWQRVASTDYQDSGELKETFLAVISEDLLPFASGISLPTLLLWGENDEDTPLWMAKTLEEAIPDAGLVIFKGAGHYSYLDALPDAVRVIDYFFTHDE